MEIAIESLLAGAQQAKGAVVIIDVLRAFTTAAVVLANGAAQIIMVGGVDEALRLRGSGAAQICMGEVGGRMPAEFDYGNSPFGVSQVRFDGQTIVQRTSAGTQGIVAAAGADRLYAGSLVTARATARALVASAAPLVTLVAMGNAGTVRTDEDELCALHLRNVLEGRAGNPQAVRDVILAAREAVRYRDGSHPHLQSHDLGIALDVDRYDFAIRVGMADGRPVARMAQDS